MQDYMQDYMQGCLLRSSYPYLRKSVRSTPYSVISRPCHAVPWHAMRKLPWKEKVSDFSNVGRVPAYGAQEMRSRYSIERVLRRLSIERSKNVLYCVCMCGPCTCIVPI